MKQENNNVSIWILSLLIVMSKKIRVFYFTEKLPMKVNSKKIVKLLFPIKTHLLR